MFEKAHTGTVRGGWCELWCGGRCGGRPILRLCQNSRCWPPVSVDAALQSLSEAASLATAQSLAGPALRKQAPRQAPRQARLVSSVLCTRLLASMMPTMRVAAAIGAGHSRGLMEPRTNGTEG